jgi:hypothetical protein
MILRNLIKNQSSLNKKILRCTYSSSYHKFFNSKEKDSLDVKVEWNKRERAICWLHVQMDEEKLKSGGQEYKSDLRKYQQHTIMDTSGRCKQTEDQVVYIANSSRRTAFHKPGCFYLSGRKYSKAKPSNCFVEGLHPCKHCFPNGF